MSVDSNRGDVAIDLAAIAAVGAILAVFHFLLPLRIQRALYFRYTLSEPWTLFTAAYLHADAGHLVDNLLGFFPASVAAYVLCLQSGERRWFRRTFVAILFSLPFLVNLTDYAIFAARFPWADPVSRGFSGVAAGFVGFLFVALLALLRTAYSRWSVFLFGQLVALLLLVEIYVIYARAVSPAVAVAVAAGAAAAGSGLVWENRRGLADLRAHPNRTALRAVRVGLVVLLLAIFTYQLFPASVVSDGSFVNVFAHGCGVAWGAVVSAACHASSPERRPSDERPRLTTD